MADTVVSALPSCLDCIDWSYDCELAVAAGGYVDILIPRVKAHQEPADGLWDTLHIRTNVYNEQEIPMQLPAPFAQYSAGEELSNGDVIALAWSPHGLGRFKRCALAVLTQNLVLSLWIAGPDPRMSFGWKRSCFINHELERYFKSLPKNSKVNTENVKALKRIRAFTWSPPTVPFSDSSGNTQTSTWRDNLLAVANGNNEIVVLWVPSLDRTASSKDAPLSPKALAHFAVESKKEVKLRSLSWTFEDHLSNDITPTRVAWSPWVKWQDGSLLAIIAYATRTKLGLRQVNVKMSKDGPKVQVGDHEVTTRFTISGGINGPLRWLPEILKNNRMQLLVSSGDTIIRYDLAAIEDVDIKRSLFFRPDWNAVSAFAFAKSEYENYQLYLPPHSSDSPDAIATLKLGVPLEADNGENPPQWRNKIAQHRSVFSKEKKLDKDVVVKIWGMASSPERNLVATAFSMSPKDALEYQIPSDQRTTISITQACTDSSLDFSTLEQGSAETKALIVKYFFSQQSAKVQAIAIKKIMEMIAAFETWNPPPVSKTDELGITGSEIPVTQMTTHIFQMKDMRLARLKYIVSLFIPKRIDDGTSFSNNHAKTSQLSNLQLTLIPRLLAKAVLDYALGLNTSVPGQLDASTEVKSVEILNAYIAASKLCGNELPSSATLPANIVGEKCEMCGANISFNNLTSALCDEGHQFVRCALTFLAVQAPGISKFCGICGKQYLEDTYLESETTAGANRGDMDITDDSDTGELGNTQKHPSFARTLFAACETCVYCGGKFVGMVGSGPHS